MDAGKEFAVFQATTAREMKGRDAKFLIRQSKRQRPIAQASMKNVQANTMQNGHWEGIRRFKPQRLKKWRRVLKKCKNATKRQ